MIKWRTIKRDQFDQVVEALLCRIHDDAGDFNTTYLGDGGDGGIDYIAVTQASAVTIYQLKCFPDGIAANRSRMGQIRDSFKKAVEGQPSLTRWVLVLPSKATRAQETRIRGLGEGHEVEIEIWNRARLDSELAKRPDIPDYFRSNKGWLQEQAELMIKNPLIRTAADLDINVRDLQSRQAQADLHWQWAISTKTGTPRYTLQAKHPWSAVVSPVKATFGVVGSTASKALSDGWRYGFPEALRVDGHLIRDFKVDGPPIVAWQGELDYLQIGPSEPGPHKPVTLYLRRRGGWRSRPFLATLRGISRGADGFVVEATVGGRARLTMWCPRRAEFGDQGRADMTVEPLEGASVNDAFDVAELVTQMPNSDEIHLRYDGGSFTAQYQVDDRVRTDYTPVWVLADDLRHIEHHAGVRFRFPGRVEPEDRVMIRNIRLMLEGKTVAHPYWNLYTADVSGPLDESLAAVLADREPDQVSVIKAAPEGVSSQVEILGEEFEVPAISVYGLLTIDETHRRHVHDALERGESKQLRLTCRPGDRIRLFMESRVDPDTPLAITPWGLPGIQQKGFVDDTAAIGPEEAA